MLEQVFEQYAKSALREPQRTITFVATLIAKIRPPKPHNIECAVKAIQALCYLLNSDTEKARVLREAMLRLLSEHKPISLFLVSRHSAFAGFFTEMRRRISHKILPEAVDTSYLIDLFALFFTKTSDALWISAVPNDIWVQLIVAMRFDNAPQSLTEPCRQNLLAATQVLSYRIAALGLEPELLRNHPELEQHTSPFITQQAELNEFLSPVDGIASLANQGDIKHILVMLNQCNSIIAKIRRNSVQVGTSIQLTFLLQGISQQISRLEALLDILDCLPSGSKLVDEVDDAAGVNSLDINSKIVQLFKELVYSECHKNDLHQH